MPQNKISQRKKYRKSAKKANADQILTNSEKLAATDIFRKIVYEGKDYREVVEDTGLPMNEVAALMNQAMLESSMELDMLKTQWLMMSIMRTNDLYSLAYEAIPSDRKTYIGVCQSLIETQLKIIEGSQPKNGAAIQINNVITPTMTRDDELYHAGADSIRRRVVDREGEENLHESVYRDLPVEEAEFAELTGVLLDASDKD